MTCPSCGAAMRLKEDKESLICDYCGTVHIPDPNSDGVQDLGVASELTCPVCPVPLVHAVIAGDPLLYCEKCRGMLIEMEVFLAVVQNLRSRHLTSADGAQPPDWRDLDRRIQCPQCKKTMDTHPYMGPGNVIIDTCEHCSLNWFDYGELQRIVRAPDRQYFIPIDEDEQDKAGRGK